MISVEYKLLCLQPHDERLRQSIDCESCNDGILLDVEDRKVLCGHCLGSGRKLECSCCHDHVGDPERVWMLVELDEDGVPTISSLYCSATCAATYADNTTAAEMKRRARLNGQRQLADSKLARLAAVNNAMRSRLAADAALAAEHELFEVAPAAAAEE